MHKVKIPQITYSSTHPVLVQLWSTRWAIEWWECRDKKIVLWPCRIISSSGCIFLVFFFFAPLTYKVLADKVFVFFCLSCRVIWTRSTKTSFAGCLWKSRSLFRTAAKPSSATTVSTETSSLHQLQRSSTTRRLSPRTTWRRARRNKSTTQLFRDLTFASHWDTIWSMWLTTDSRMRLPHHWSKL